MYILLVNAAWSLIYTDLIYKYEKIIVISIHDVEPVSNRCRLLSFKYQEMRCMIYGSVKIDLSGNHVTTNTVFNLGPP